ncbi:MAG: hypothetical protein K1X94_00755, partial [Sandaracinaceae bacterium]|nr:hypothetical protein [Sandaracinaceae bacterium]
MSMARTTLALLPRTSLALLPLVALGCDPSPASDAGLLPDAAIALDAPPTDDAFVPVMDWPASEVPVSTEVEPGIVRELVEIDGFDAPPNPEGTIDTPEAYDRARFVRYRASTATEPRAIVLAMPGIFGGAGSFAPLARAIVRRSRASGSATGAIEVWAIDRRSNFL